MVPTWLTIYLTNYVINQWPTAFGPISNPSVFEVLYLLKYFGGFGYFISHDIKNRFKNAVTLHQIADINEAIALHQEALDLQPTVKNTGPVIKLYAYLNYIFSIFYLL